MLNKSLKFVEHATASYIPARDQSHRVKNWCLMAEFQTFNRCYSKEVGRMWLKFCKTLVTRKVFTFGLFIVVIGTAIIHQQLVAMQRGNMRFVYIRYIYRLLFDVVTT